MKRAPRIDNYDLSRKPHGLRFKRHAQIQITEPRRLLKSTGRHEYRQKSPQKPDEIARISPTNTTCPVRFKATAPRKSP